MIRAAIATGTSVTALALLLGFVVRNSLQQDVAPTPELSRSITPPTPAAAEARSAVSPGFLFGRITTLDGAAYEGRLRWGRDQEAFWGDYFNGAKSGNPWSDYAPRRNESGRIEIFGFEIGGRDQ